MNERGGLLGGSLFLILGIIAVALLALGFCVQRG